MCDVPVPKDARVHCAATSCSGVFSLDGHDRCVNHRSCTRSGFHFDPEACSVCREHVTFLCCRGSIDKSLQQYQLLLKAWLSLTKSAYHHKKNASWVDGQLQGCLRMGQASDSFSQSSWDTCLSPVVTSAPVSAPSPAPL